MRSLKANKINEWSSFKISESCTLSCEIYLWDFRGGRDMTERISRRTLQPFLLKSVRNHSEPVFKKNIYIYLMQSTSDDSQKELSSITRGFTGPNIITTTRLVRGIQHQQQHKMNPERCYTYVSLTFSERSECHVLKMCF